MDRETVAEVTSLGDRNKNEPEFWDLPSNNGESRVGVTKMK
jgi:hypothetical protein